MVLANCGTSDAEDIEEYIAKDGYAAFEKALFEMTDEEICKTIIDSGLRGCGGGGFPAGRKWDGTRRQKTAVKYIVCNGDEGDLGAFMNRSIMEGNPHSVLEGMMIAGRAVGARDGYIYVRAEYPLAVSHLKTAIARAGNQTAMPSGLLKGVRTMTANIVIEMGYAQDLHRQALFATGVVLFVFILLINLCFSCLKRKGEAQ